MTVGPDGFPDDGPAAPGGFRGFFGPAAPPPPGEEGDFEDGDFGPDGGPQGGLGSLFGFGPQPPPGGDGDFGPDGFPDEQPSGGMAFFFGGPDKGGYMPPGMEGPEDGEGPPMDLFTAPGIWTNGGITSFGGPAGEGMPMPPPGEPVDADDLFMMFAGPEGDFGPDGFPDDGPAAPGGFRGFFGGAPLPPGQDGDFEDGDFGPDGGPQGGLGSLFGFGPQPPPGGDGDFGPDGFPDEQPSGGMAFFFGGPDKGGYMPPGMEGPEDGEGPPMDLFNAPGIWTSGGTTSFGGPAGEGMPMPPPGEPVDADDLFMMFAGPEGPFGLIWS